jgi:oligopeptide transport system substrate-binding protein
MKNKLRKTFGLLCIFCLVFIIQACNSNIKQENKRAFKYNEASGVSSLDPAFAKNQANIWACNQIFSGLLKLDDKLNIKPAIAKSWIISENGKTYTFILRNDVYFHDHDLFKNEKGRRVVASDFEYSFNRILDPIIASPGSWVFNYVDIVDGRAAFEALNDTVFKIRLKKAFPPFLGILGMQYCSVVPKEVVEYYGKDFRQNPIGTGPFQFKFWKEGIKLVFIKNPYFYENDKEGKKLPYLDAVSITFLKDKQSAFLEFIKGNLDFMSGIDPNYKDELLTKSGKLNPKYAPNIYLEREAYLNTEYLGILVDSAIETAQLNPLMIKKIRQAINFGFNRKEMIKYLRNGIGTPGNFGMIPVGLPSFDAEEIKGYYYDPEKARKLLNEAGFPNAQNLPEITLATTSEYLDLCKYIQHQLSLLGIEVSINVNTSGALRELKAQSKSRFFRASWIADYPDAENYLSLFYSKNFAPNGPNYTHYSNPEFDRLYIESQNIIDDSLRYTYYRKLDNMLMEDAPVVILYYDEVLRFVNKRISGLGSNPINLLDLSRVKKK